MFREEDFEDIRPYYDHEINSALIRIISNPVFGKILDFLFPGQDHEKIRQMLASTHTAHDFQFNFMHPLVRSIVGKTSDGLTTNGWEYLVPGTSYLFISNHRDIVLDSAILQVLLFDHGHETSEITFGSNLMVNQFVIDLGKVNRMFRVERGAGKAELLSVSRKLSSYIRHTLTGKKASVWIAQRPGRTKDGNDRTETGLLKMLNMSGGENFRESVRELNIVPVSISYEYEPCCAFKIRELLVTRHAGTYRKAPDEDLVSIIKGITQPKGRIHISITRPVNDYIGMIDEADMLNNKLNALAGMMDEEIYSAFRLWPGNYIAFDIMHNSEEYRSFYTPAEKDTFLNYMKNEITGIEGNRGDIEKLFLEIYANPVINLRSLKTA
jgi:hypothetical protein